MLGGKKYCVLWMGVVYHHKFAKQHCFKKKKEMIWNSKKGNAKECSHYCTTALISHASKIILKIPQARLQQYMNHELPDIQVGFRKCRRTRDQTVNICWMTEKSSIPEKHLLLIY